MNRRPGKGFTVVELLVAVAILVVVFALALPAFRGARERAYLADSISAMRQLGHALALYRADWEVDPNSADSDLLGFPPDRSPEWRKYPYQPQRPKRAIVVGRIDYLRSARDGDEWGWSNWRTHVGQCRSTSVWTADFGHNDFDLFRHPSRLKVGVGLQLDGAVRVHRAYGDVFDVNWWGCKSP